MRTLCGLYAITSEAICQSQATLVDAVSGALAGGARLIQYRDKKNDPAVQELHARALLALCRARNALLIVNDDAELAARIGADGVHVGSADAGPARVRSICGDDAIIGVSCGNSIERAIRAASDGASYVAFGRFFASQTKPDAPPADVDVLRRARERLTIPICAIGGITPGNARPLIDAGAHMVAAIEGVFGAADVRAAAASYTRNFS